MTAHLKLITSIKKINSLYDSGAVFCAFDTETTGINPENERLIEIGAVKFTKDGIIETFSSLINPKKTLTPFIKELTGITDEMLLPSPFIETVLPQFRDFCRDSVLVAHNAQFDLRFVNKASQNLNLQVLQNEAIDTLRLSRILLPDNLTWKQPSLAAQFNIDTGNAHRAFDDALVCSKLFQILIKLPVPKKKKRCKTTPSQNTYSLNAASLATQALL